MGDRAYAQVLCRAKDVAAFEELGFGEEEYWQGLPEGVSFLVDQEANYGHSFLLCGSWLREGDLHRSA